MKERSELIGNKRDIRDSTIKSKILEFIKYYESKGLYPKNDIELKVIEFEACRLIAASTIQVNLDRTINNLGGYDKFVAKMCELANESARIELASRIENGMSLGNIDEIKLKFLSVGDTIKVLLEEKGTNKKRI